jgi:fructose-bisphosphate aldolase, class II
MPVPSSEQFLGMLERAKKEHFAFPAINVASIDAANGAIAAFAATKSDGIIQVSLGGAKFVSGPADSAVIGAISIAEHIHRIVAKLDIFVALHTDHCQEPELPFVLELIKESKRRKDLGQPILFNGHMFDGSALPLQKNLEKAKEILQLCGEVGLIPEFEVGAVGGEEEGAASADSHDSLYTTPADMLKVANELFPLGIPFMFAATFGNVHGIYKPGNVKLKPEILKNGQELVGKEYNKNNPFFLVFHGGSGTPVQEIRETLDYGVIKMNVDTATQYAFTRPIADHMLKNYDSVVMVDGDMGDKKLYDPRSYLKKARQSMEKRVVQALDELRSLGKSNFKKIN